MPKFHMTERLYRFNFFPFVGYWHITALYTSYKKTKQNKKKQWFITRLTLYRGVYNVLTYKNYADSFARPLDFIFPL